MMPQRYGKLVAAILMLSWPVLLLAGVAGWIDAYWAWMTFLGSIGASIGGMTIGVTARRFLAGSAPRIIFGFGTASATGTVTLGFLYIFLMQYRFDSIGTFTRTFSQSIVFADFLLAQYVGIALVYPWLAQRLRWDRV